MSLASDTAAAEIAGVKVMSAAMRASPSLMCLSIVLLHAVPTMKNSVRLACLAAASEPMLLVVVVVEDGVQASGLRPAGSPWPAVPTAR